MVPIDVITIQPRTTASPGIDVSPSYSLALLKYLKMNRVRSMREQHKVITQEDYSSPRVWRGKGFQKSFMVSQSSNKNVKVSFQTNRPQFLTSHGYKRSQLSSIAKKLIWVPCRWFCRAISNKNVSARGNCVKLSFKSETKYSESAARLFWMSMVSKLIVINGSIEQSLSMLWKQVPQKKDDNCI